MKQFLITVGGVVVGGFLFFILGLFVLFGFLGAASAPAPSWCSQRATMRRPDPGGPATAALMPMPKDMFFLFC